MLSTSTKEYETRHDKMGEGIHLESCKKLKFDHTNKCYTQKLESYQEIETHKTLLDFEIQTNDPIPAKRSDLVMI